MRPFRIEALMPWVIITTNFHGLKAFRTQSFTQKFSVPKDVNVSNINTKLKRNLVQDIECSVCGNFEGASLIPNAVPFPEVPDYTCSMTELSSSMEIIPMRKSYIHPSIPECQYFRSLVENQCCDLSSFRVNAPYKCQQNVHSLIIDESYDTSIAPHADWKEDLTINTLIDIWAIDSINLAASEASFFVDVYLSWRDPRLAWTITPDTCTTTTTVWASHNPETTEIWVSSLDLGNRKQGLKSLDESRATVYNDGTVIWKLNGCLSTFCSFTGLRRIPFDTLGCELIFHTIDDVEVINLIQTGDDEEQKGIRFQPYKQTYREYTLSKERAKTKILSPNPNKMPNTFTLEIYLKNSASMYYVMLIVVPTILFVYMSFGKYFFDPESSDRLSVVINALLIVVANSIITTGFLPVCGEKLWLNNLMSGCIYTVVIIVFETLLFSWVLSLHKKKSYKKEMLRASIVNLDARNGSEGFFDAISEKAEETSDVTLAMTSLHSFIDRLQLTMSWVDNVGKYLFPLGFTLFLIVMFATNKNLEDNEEDIWYSYQGYE